MKRRTFISLMSVMAAAGVLALAGCSSNSGSSAAASGAASSAASTGAADQLAAIQTNGKLVVALEGAWQPWSYHDESDTLVGYDVEVSRAIAEKLGVEPEYVESDWDSLFAGLDAGRYDMVCNGVEVTDERALTYDFTTPYGYIHTALAVKKDNDTIQTFEDLKGKTVSVGAANSGVYFNAVDILGAYGIDVEKDISAVYQNFADSADSLKNGKVDAAFIVAGAPTTAITDLSTSKQAYLVSMDAKHIAKLQETSPYYAAATIPAGTYSGMDADTTTVSVLSVVLANNSVSEDDVYNFTKSLFDGAQNNADAHAKYKELDLETATSITSVPYHAGAAKYYKEQNVEVPTA